MGSGFRHLFVFAILAAVFFVSYQIIVFAAGIDSVNLVSPENGTWFSKDNDTIKFIFNYTGENATASCELFVEGTPSGTNSSVINNTNTTIYSNSSLSEGHLSWLVNCTNGSSLASGTRILSIDRTDPLVSFVSPATTYNTTQNSINFSFNVTDNMDKVMECYIYVNSTLVDTNSTVANATRTYFNETGLSAGLNQNWTVNCSDSANNSHQPSEIIFNIDQSPPYYTDTSDNSSGNVAEGSIVGISVYWNDNLGLDTGILRTNLTSTWENSTYCGMSGSSGWCNGTINTTGYPETTVCWNEYANDTLGQSNNSMPATCFYIAPPINPGNLSYAFVPSPVWVNMSRGDMFFYDSNEVFIAANFTNFNGTPATGLDVSADFSPVGGAGSMQAVERGDGLYELNDTIDYSSIPGGVQNIFPYTVNVTAQRPGTTYQLNVSATVLLVNMTTVPGCPPNSSEIPEKMILLNGTEVNVSGCNASCSGYDRAEWNGTDWLVCGPNFGGDTTNFSYIADTGNFSEFPLVLDIPGLAKINFTDPVDMSTQERSQAIMQFAMENLMTAGEVGVNETEWGGANPNKPNLSLQAEITMYNISGLLKISGEPQIIKSDYGGGNEKTCDTCSNIIWDGENMTFLVSSFSDYGLTDGINVTLQSPGNFSYGNSLNFTYTPTWNSTVKMDNCTLYGNFSGVWEANQSNQSALSNGSVNWIDISAQDNTYIWNVYCFDTAGMKDFYSINWTITLDTDAPDITINEPLNETVQSDAFNFTYSDVNCSVYSINGNPNVTNCSIVSDDWSGNFGGLSDGQNYVTVWVNDSVGNWNSSQRYWTRDTDAPDFTLEHPANESYPRTWAWANITLDQDADWCGYSLNGSSNVTMSNDSGTHYYANVSSGEGQQNIIFWCNDTAGNMNISSTVLFRFDVTYPAMEIVLPENTTYGSTSRTLNYTYTESNEDTCWYEYNSSNTTLVSCGNTSFTALDNQASTLVLWINDTAGNTNSSSVTFTVDTDAPDFTLEHPANESYPRTWAWANITLDQDADWCGYSLNGSSNVTMSNDSGTHYYANVSSGEGQQNIIFWCNDTAGNMNISSTVLFRFDVTYPAMEIVLPENTTYGSTSRTLNYTYTESNEDTCWYEYNSSNTTLVSCGNTSFTALDNQASTLVLWINDTAGNTNSSSVTFTVDTDAPSITINDPVNDTVNSNDFSFTYGESVNWTAYSVDGAANVTNSSVSEWSGTLTGLSDGVHNVTVWANDSVGKMRSSTRWWTRDTDTPDIFNVTNGTAGSSSASIIWNTTQSSNSTVYYGTNQSTLNQDEGNSSFVTEHSVSLCGLSAGTTYYYNVSSCDQAGNCNNTGTYNFTTSESSGCTESWSCTSWTICIGNLQTRTCTDSNNCGTTVNKPAESQWCRSGGGGAPSEEEEEEPEKKHSWIEILPEENATMKINKSGLDFTEIKIKVKEIVESVSLTVKKLSEKPEWVGSGPSGKVYQYVSVTTENFEEDKIDKTSISFRVPKSWVRENNIDRNSILLMRFKDTWQRLATRLIGEDSDNIYFEAETPGFSYFAISGEEKMVCEAGAKRCSGDILQQCRQEGSGWITLEECEHGCDTEALECKEMVCEPGITRCSGDLLQICPEEGSGWITLEECEHGCIRNERCRDSGVVPGISEIDYKIISGYVLIALTLVLIIMILKPIRKKRKKLRTKSHHKTRPKKHKTRKKRKK